MSAESLKRPAFGQAAKLGMLYDARNDRFLPYSVLEGSLSGEVVTCVDVNPKHQTVISDETYKDKFDKMGVPSELGASFLAGFINIEGSGSYLLTPERDTALTVHRALHYTITTLRESLNFSAGNFKDHLTADELPGKASATHLVTEITWGARCIVAATQSLSSEDDRPEIEKRLESAFEAFEWTDEWGFDGTSTYPAQLKQEFGKITVHSDILEHDEHPPNDLDGAHTHFVNLPSLVQETCEGKGKPLAYTLIPIGFLSMFFGVTIPPAISPGNVSPECQEKFVRLLDELRVALGLLSDYYQRLDAHSVCVRSGDIFRISSRMRSAGRAESDLRSRYAKLLKDIRAGRASSQDVWQLVESFLGGDSAPKALTAITDECSERLSFVDLVEGKGAKYVGYDGPSRHEFNEAERKNSWGDAYVFYFNDVTMKNTQSWKEHVDLLIKILDDLKRKGRVFVVDCNATGTRSAAGTPFQELCICQYQNNSLATTNVLKQRKHLADKCIMRYDPQYLDATVKDDPWPPKRKMVKIRCPGGGLNCNSDHDWICFKCHVSVEYGTDDSYMYCECGRVQCRGLLYDFDCQRPGHTPHYAKYGDIELLRIMKALKPAPEINILILGESGVGKSTFINAFINYLTFSSLDHALSATQLNWIIPCSFATSTVEGPTGRLVQRVVQIGSSDVDEVSGVKGQSATQKATAYPIYIGGKLVRLIDTPGIGDVRGIEQDKLNMVHTLSVLKNYDTLHGIMILLKPNNSRLGIMFKFCINELLTHLHRDAANNMVFGFTNTRGAMYTPGDAVGPLETQLQNYKGVLPGLYRHTVYCFDSESFRYLAARKQEDEIDLGNLDDYRRSWDHSADESQRLMDYFEKRNPHLVKSTLGLAETRDLIARLVQPMAEVIKVVSVTIEQSKKDMKDLSMTQKSGAELKGLLLLTQTNLVTEVLKSPYTVCDNPACVSRVSRPGGEGGVVLRKSLCHDPCSLKEITLNERGAVGITGCWAFTNGRCRKCHHNPEDHMHVDVLYTEKTETTMDPIVQAKLNANASELQIKEAQLNAMRQRLAKYQAEKDLLEDAQAKFSWYLENNSITVYNDVTIEYLDHLIKDEKAKMEPNDASRANLIGALEASKKKHQEFVTAMRKGKQAQPGSKYQILDEPGVHRLITSLCAMEHYGKQLKDAADAVQDAYAKQFREIPYRVRPEAFMSGAPASSSKRSNSTAKGVNNSRSAGLSGSQKPVRSMISDFDDRSEGNSEIAPVLPPWPPQESAPEDPLPEPSKKGLVNGNAKYEQPAPPPYESSAFAPSAPAHTASNRHQSQSSSKRRGFRHFLRVKVLRLSS